MTTSISNSVAVSSVTTHGEIGHPYLVPPGEVYEWPALTDEQQRNFLQIAGPDGQNFFAAYRALYLTGRLVPELHGDWTDLRLSVLRHIGSAAQSPMCQGLRAFLLKLPIDPFA